MHDSRITNAVGTSRQGAQLSALLRVDDCASGERGRRFMRVLDSGRAGCDELPVPAPSVRVPVLITEPPPAPASAEPSTARGAAEAVDAAARVADRLLIGTGPGGAEARLRFGAGAGPLAGVEVELRATGGVIELRIAGCSEGGRRALADAIAQVATKLRARGVVLKQSEPGGRSSVGLLGWPLEDDQPLVNHAGSGAQG